MACGAAVVQVSDLFWARRLAASRFCPLGHRDGPPRGRLGRGLDGDPVGREILVPKCRLRKVAEGT